MTKRIFQSRAALLFFFLGIAFLTEGTVLKKKDAVEMTQTDPVGYAEKEKEETEGKKGPPAPSFGLFPKQRFLTEPPLEESRKPMELLPAEGVESDFWFEEPEEDWENEEELGVDEFKLLPESDDTGKDDPASRKKSVS